MTIYLSASLTVDELRNLAMRGSTNKALRGKRVEINSRASEEGGNRQRTLRQQGARQRGSRCVP